MANMTNKCYSNSVSSSLDYVSVSDSLDTLIKMAKGQLKTNSSNSPDSSVSMSVSPSITSSASSTSSTTEEPIYMEMSKTRQTSQQTKTKPTFTDYMDMDVVQKALEQ